MSAPRETPEPHVEPWPADTRALVWACVLLGCIEVWALAFKVAFWWAS